MKKIAKKIVKKIANKESRPSVLPWEKSLVAEAVQLLFKTRREEVQKVVLAAKSLTAAQRRNLGPVGLYLLALLEREEKTRSVLKKK